MSSSNQKVPQCLNENGGFDLRPVCHTEAPQTNTLHMKHNPTIHTALDLSGPYFTSPTCSCYALLFIFETIPVVQPEESHHFIAGKKTIHMLWGVGGSWRKEEMEEDDVRR